MSRSISPIFYPSLLYLTISVFKVDSFLIFFYESIFLILLLRFVSRARFLWKRNLEFLEAVVTPGGGGS